MQQFAIIAFQTGEAFGWMIGDRQFNYSPADSAGFSVNPTWQNNEARNWNRFGMTYVRNPFSPLKSLLTAISGCLAMSVMVWTVLTDPILANVLLPRELHAQLVLLVEGGA